MKSLLCSFYLEMLSVHSISVYYCKSYKRGRCLSKEEGRQERKERRKWGKKERKKLMGKRSDLEIFDLQSSLTICVWSVIIISCVIILFTYICIS